MDGRTASAPKGERAYDLVIPTRGSASVNTLLASLVAARGPMPDHIFVVDDRKGDGRQFVPIDVQSLPPEFASRIALLRSRGMGPAFARNLGWGASRAVWVAFLDDDLIVDAGWPESLARDLEAIERESDASRVAGSFGAFPTSVADAVLRRTSLDVVEGFDPRFPHAYREGADLALRLERSGYRFTRGSRVSSRPVRHDSAWHELAQQSRNQDDAVMTALHGADWQKRANDDKIVYAKHVATVGAALDAVGALLEGRRRAAIGFGLAWGFGTALLAARRIAAAPGANFGDAIAILTTSVALPFAAVAHRLHGEHLATGLVRPRIRGVIFDREGTLVQDGAIDGDATRVVAIPGAAPALKRLRDASLRVGILMNEPGLAGGKVTPAQHDAVNARVGELVGPFDAWAVCAHAENAACACRKPRPDLVTRAARDLGIPPEQCVVIGDAADDLEMARAAGAQAILVPSGSTTQRAIDAAPHVAGSLDRAVDMVLAGRL